MGAQKMAIYYVCMYYLVILTEQLPKEEYQPRYLICCEKPLKIT